MKHSHPNIVVREPAPGHFVIEGHKPRQVFVEGEGWVIPPESTYIPPEVPSDILLAIVKEREAAEAPEEQPAKRKPGRPKKADSAESEAALNNQASEEDNE